MTLTESAAAMRRLADGIDKIALKFHPSTQAPFGNGTMAMLDEDQATGAAALLCFIRDLVTTAPRDTYSREDLLVLLETISRDAEIFPLGTGQLIWQLEDEEEEL